MELVELAGVGHEQRFHLRELCGREAVLAEIDGWIAQHADGGVLLLTGGPGAGKSAIAAEVARRHDAALHMMKAHRAPARFVGSLVRQLLDRAAIAARAPAAADVDDLRTALLDALEALATSSGIAVAVIDGLDELDGEAALDVLPRHPPPGVRVILTTRPDHAILRKLRRTVGELDEQPLPPLARAEVQAILDKRAGRVIDPGITAAIVAMTSGLPILVRHAADALRGDIDGFAVGALPSTLSAFGADAYRAIRGGGEDAGDRGRIVQLLSVAREALGAAELVSLLALDDRMISLERCRDHLEAMSSWLVEHETGAFRLFHEALAEHIRTEVLGEAGTRKCHAHLAVWAAAEWRSAHAVRHHVRYLLAAGDLEQAREVLERPETLTAKLVHELVFELVRELDLAASPLAPAVRRHAHFLARHPFALGSVVDVDVPIRLRTDRPASDAATRAGELFVLRGHEGEVYDVALAPGGKRLASVGADATLRLWDLESTGPLRTVDTGGRRALSVAIADDGRIACGTDGAGFLVLDEAGEELSRARDGSVAWSVDWAPDGKLAIGMRSGEVEIRDRSGETVGTFAIDGIVTAVKFSRDGERLAVATTRGKIVVTDGAGSTVFRAGPLADTPWALAWTVERTLVAACADGLVREWSDGGLPGRERAIADDRLYGAAFSPDGALLALAGKRGAIHLGSPGGDDLVTAAAHDGAIHAIAFADHGDCLFTASSDGTVRGFSPSAVQASRPESDRPHALALSPDGGLVATGHYDGVVRLLDVGAGRAEICRLEAHASRVTGLAFSRDGALFASASQDGVAKVFRVAPLRSKASRRAPVAELSGHEGAVTCIDVVGTGGRVLTGSRDRTARVWSVFGARQLCAIAHDETVVAVASDAAGELGATLARDGALLVFRVEDGAVVARAPGSEHDERHALDFCAEGTLRVRDRRGAWTVWRIDGAALRPLDLRAARAFLPRFTLRADPRWQESVLVDSSTGRPVAAFPGFLALAASSVTGELFAGWWAGGLQIFHVEESDQKLPPVP